MKMIMGNVIYTGMEEHCQNLSKYVIPLRITPNKLQIWNILLCNLPGNDIVKTGKWAPTSWTMYLEQQDSLFFLYFGTYVLGNTVS